MSSCKRIFIRLTNKFRSLNSCLITILLVLLVYTVYEFWDTKKRMEIKKGESHNSDNFQGLSALKSKLAVTKGVVDIWGKAAIGLYLWEHIFRGEYEYQIEGYPEKGQVSEDGIEFRFQTGPQVVQNRKENQNVENLVLVLNGRTKEKVQFAQSWLDYLPKYKRLKKVGLVILGNEECKNDWLHPYLKRNGGLLEFIFLVYDSPEVDNIDIYQWPLGVATYRNFPNIEPEDLNPDFERGYICNFQGTIYPNSSRTVLDKILKEESIAEECISRPRYSWEPNESDEEMKFYTRTILNSDLTLNPVGVNTECYRIYEAMALGTVPVIENVFTPGNCDRTKSPLRLLNEYGIPAIFIDNWKKLPNIIEKEKSLEKSGDIIPRRKAVLKWYKTFKESMKKKFISVVDKKFFN